MKVYLYKPIPAFHLVIEQLSKFFDVIRINQSEHLFHFTSEAEAVLVLPPEAESLELIEKIRFEQKGAIPIVLLSHESTDKTAARFRKSPESNEPIIRFCEGTYHIQLPAELSEILRVLEEARPVPKDERKRLKEKHDFLVRLQKDREFRHRCAGLTSAIRIFQGALYAKDITKQSYKFTIKSLRRLSERFKDLHPYKKMIEDHLKEMPAEGEVILEDIPQYLPTAHPLKVLLLDDEAESAGWSPALQSILEPQGFSFAFETDREVFRSRLEEGDEAECDILLLDLRMPDSPERSVEIIERLRDRFPGIVVIVFTAVNDIKYFNQCKAAGAFDYFVKEFGPDDRKPLAYYQRLKWLLGRARELVLEKRRTRRIETRIGEPAFYTCKRSITIPVWEQEERMIVQEEWNSYFAFVATSVALAREGTTAEIEDTRTRLISWLLRGLSDGKQLSLRYIFYPDQDVFTIALIGKGRTGSKEESIKRARSMFRDVYYLVRDLSAYSLVAVKNAEDLFSLLEPFKIVDVVTLHREQTDLEINGERLTGYYPYSFNEKTSLDKLVGMLLSHDASTMINIGLWPISLDKEKERLADKVRKARTAFDMRNSTGEAVVYSEQSGARLSRRVPLPGPDAGLLERQGKALKLIESQLESSNDGYLLARFDVASGSEIPSAILETVRYDFWGPNGKVRIERYTGEKLDDHLDKLRELDLQRPRKEENLLGSLVDISQAKCIFQLPIPGPDGVKGIKTEFLKKISVPTKIRKKLTEEGDFVVAESFLKDEILPVRLASKDLMQHLYVCGRTGSGKSTLLLKLALSLAEKGKGLCLIDPHGDLSFTFRTLLPPYREKDLIYFDPVDPGCPIRLNLLENDGSAAQQERIYQEFMGMLLRLYSSGDHMGPAFERVFRPGFFLVMMVQGTLIDLPRIWSDSKFRQSCIEKVDQGSPMGREAADFFKRELPNLLAGDWGKGFETYVLSKIGRFVSDETMRRVLSSSVSTIDFHEVLAKDKILVARLPKGPLGEINAYLLGMITSSKLRQAIMEQGKVPEDQRKDFYFIIDEFQNFVSSGGMGYTHDDDPAFSSLLSEARKFKVSMILANQYIHQLGQGMRNAVFGNIQSRILFGVGAEDAQFIKSQIPMGPDPAAYVSCPNYYAHAQLLVDGEQIGPFTIRTIVPAAQK